MGVRKSLKDVLDGKKSFILSNYIIELDDEEPIVGEGGTCIVYKAWQKNGICSVKDREVESDDKRIILKEFYPELKEDLRGERVNENVPSIATNSSKEYTVKLDRFKKSYKLFRWLYNNYDTNNNATRVDALLKANNTWYIIADYNNGVILEKYMKDATLYDFVYALKKIAEVVDSIHNYREEGEDAGYLHLDLSPSNIMYCVKDKYAIFIDTDSFLKKSENKAGKLSASKGYAMFEQRIGDEWSIDERTDVGSLGCIFYTYLTGEILEDDLDFCKMSAEELEQFDEKIRKGIVNRYRNAKDKCVKEICEFLHNTITYIAFDRYENMRIVMECLEKIQVLCGPSYEDKRKEFRTVVLSILLTETPKFKGDEIEIVNCPLTLFSFQKICDYYFLEREIGKQFAVCENDLEKLNILLNRNDDDLLSMFSNCEFVKDKTKEHKDEFKEREIILLQLRKDVEVRDIEVNPSYVLEKLDDIYNKLSDSFHNIVAATDNRTKKEINKTVSEYIRALAFGNVFYELERKMQLIDIVNNQIEKHNHDNNYMYALVEKDLETGRFLLGIPNRDEAVKEGSLVNSILCLFGKYYKDVFETDSSYIYFGNKLIEWLQGSLDKGFVLEWIQKYIYEYYSYDSALWQLYLRYDANKSKTMRMYLCSTVFNRKNFRKCMIDRQHAIGFLSIFSKGEFDILCKDSEIPGYINQMLEYVESVLKHIDCFVDQVNRNMMAQGIKNCLCYIAKQNIEYKKLIENLLEEFALKCKKDNKEDDMYAVPFKELYSIIVEGKIGSCNSSDIVYLLDNGSVETLKNMNYLQKKETIKYLLAIVDEISKDGGKKYSYAREFYNSAIGFLLDNMIQDSRMAFIDLDLCSDVNKERMKEYYAEIIDNEQILSFRYNAIEQSLRKLDDEKYYKKVFFMLCSENIEDRCKCILFNIIRNKCKTWDIIGILHSWKREFDIYSEENAKILSVFENLLSSKYVGWARGYLVPAVKILINEKIFFDLPQNVRKVLLTYVNNKFEYYNEFSRILHRVNEDKVLWESICDNEKISISLNADIYFDEISGNIRRYLQEIKEELISNIYTDREIKDKYGIAANTLRFQLIKLFRRCPEETSIICAFAISKFYGHMCHSEEKDIVEIGLNKYMQRQRLLNYALKNPSILAFSRYMSNKIAREYEKSFNAALSISNIEILKSMCNNKVDYKWFEYDISSDFKEIQATGLDTENVLLNSIEMPNERWFKEKKDEDVNKAYDEWWKEGRKDVYNPSKEVILYKTEDSRYKVISGSHDIYKIKCNKNGFYPTDGLKVKATIINPSKCDINCIVTRSKPIYVGINIREYYEKIVCYIKDAVENTIPVNERKDIISLKKYKLRHNVYFSEYICNEISEFLYTYNCFRSSLGVYWGPAYESILYEGKRLLRKINGKQILYKAYIIKQNNKKVGILCRNIENNKTYYMFIPEKNHNQLEYDTFYNWEEKGNIKNKTVCKLIKSINSTMFIESGEFCDETLRIEEAHLESAKNVYIYDLSTGYKEISLGHYGYYMDDKYLNYDRYIRKAIHFYLKDDKRISKVIRKSYEGKPSLLIEKLRNAIGKEAIICDMIFGFTEGEPKKINYITRVVPACNIGFIAKILKTV